MTDFALKPHAAVGAYDLALASVDDSSQWRPLSSFDAGSDAGEPLATWEQLSNTDLRLDYGLKTAVLLSLFADRRWSDDAPVALSHIEEDPRGWCGETIAFSKEELNDHPWGSWLWLFRRAKFENTGGSSQIVLGQTRLPLQYLEDHLNDCLSWMSAGEIAEKTAVNASVQATQGITRLHLHVQIWRPDDPAELPSLDSLWSLTLDDQLTDHQAGAPA